MPAKIHVGAEDRSKNFVMTTEEEKRFERHDYQNPIINLTNFLRAREFGRLNSSRGRYVAFYAGNRVGEGDDGNELYRVATDAYGIENVAVFRVPEKFHTWKTKRGKTAWGRYS